MNTYMGKQYFDLMIFFEGYVRNYRRLNLHHVHNRSMFTKREIDYFSNLGEMLGYYVFIEDSKPDKIKGRSRPMDLSWWKWDERIDKENYCGLILHLERENSSDKDEETIEKLFSITDDAYVPHNIIGILKIETEERIQYLNKLIIEYNKRQRSNVLMIYRVYNAQMNIERVWAYYISESGQIDVRKAVCRMDDLNYWYMCFEEEFRNANK